MPRCFLYSTEAATSAATGAAAVTEEEQAEQEMYALFLGACTTTFLSTAAVTEPEKSHTWIELLDEMQTKLSGLGFEQVPQLSTSKQIDLNEPFSIMKPGSTKHKALIIAVVSNTTVLSRYMRYYASINYTYQDSELNGRHNDALNMRHYAMRSGYSADNVQILLDLEGFAYPTADNMRAGFQWLVDGADKDTSLFLYYTGHGGQIPVTASFTHDRDSKPVHVEATRSECVTIVFANNNTQTTLAMRLMATMKCSFLLSSTSSSSYVYYALTSCLCALCGLIVRVLQVDCNKAGCIVDDELLETLVVPLPEGCELTVFMDCCHAVSLSLQQTRVHYAHTAQHQVLRCSALQRCLHLNANHKRSHAATCTCTVYTYAGSMLDLPYTFMGTAGLISDVEAGRVAAELVSHHSN
eukprot:14802-Heterococcus_DN1.PRE.3